MECGNAWEGTLGWEARCLRGLPTVYGDIMMLVLLRAHMVCVCFQPLLHQTVFSM